MGLRYEHKAIRSAKFTGDSRGKQEDKTYRLGWLYLEIAD